MHYTLCDMFSDLTQNAVESGADTITVELELTAGKIFFSVTDNGKGMTPEEQDRALDPFWTDGVKHPGRKVGLGLPFLIQTADATGGSWTLQSEKGAGTTVTCTLDPANIDTPPVGNVTGFFRHILTFEGRYELCIACKGKAEFTVCRSELLEALGIEDGTSGMDVNALSLLGHYLESLMEE